MAPKKTTRAIDSTPPKTAQGSVGQEPVERGASGTQNFSGYITGEEYNPKLQPPDSFRIYDEMRMSDPQVQASLEIVKTPLMSANWSVQAPENPTPEEQGVADFCQSALFARGAMSDTWAYFLEHALLQLDFGVSPFEKVWTLSGDGRIRLSRLAPRLPKTVQRWNVDERGGTGRLESIEQLVQKDGRFQNITIPTESLVVFVRKREGDNWWGRSILRSAYKPWFYTCQGEKAEAVRIFRYGVGVPMAIRDKDYSPAANELDEVTAIVKGMVSHERSHVVTHSGWTWKIMVPEGSAGGDTGTRAFIEHHGRLIMRNVLAEFMAGGADGLNSGRTRTLANVFASQLYTTAENISDTLDLHVLRPLCAYNFPMEAGGLRYPTLVANDVTDVDVKQLADIVTRLTALRVLTADDELEGFLREMLGLPALPKALKGQSRERVSVSPAQQLPPSSGPSTESKAARALRDARPALALARKDRVLDWGGRLYSRQPTTFELRVFSLADVPDRLDRETEGLITTLADLRRRQLEKLADQIATKDARTTTGEFTDIRPTEFSVPLKADVERAIKQALLRVAAFGADQVRLELQRQGADIAAQAPFPGDARVLAGAGANKTIAKSALTTSAKIATETETDAWFNRILETAARLRRGGTQGDDLADAIQQTLLPELDTGLKALAKGEMHEGFAIGRAAEATRQQDRIELVEYSALLDANTCDPCADEDGHTFAFDSDEYHRTLPPFKDCDGNKGRPDACRCVHLFHLK